MKMKTRWIPVVALMMLAAIEVGAQAPGSFTTNAHATENSKKVVQSYVCPMHPEVRSTKPGKCPKCKMDLRLTKTETSPVVVNDSKPDESASTETRKPNRKMAIPDVEVLDQDGN